MKWYRIVIFVLLALVLFLVPACAAEPTVEPGDYIDFTINAPGSQAIQFYVVGMNKFFVSDPEKVSTKKLTNKELEEYLKTNMYYVYKDKDGKYIIYLQISQDRTADNYFDIGEYQLIVQHPGADGIFNTKAVAAPGYGYTSGYNIITNNVFMFNVPAIGNLNVNNALVKAITSGNDISTTKKFTVKAVGSAQTEIQVIPEIPKVEELPTVIEEEKKEVPTETTPTEPVKSPVSLLGILAGIMGGLWIVKRR